MKIVNDDLTASYRKPGKCRWCRKSCKMLCGAHIFAKGHGGGRQIDIPCNLVSLGMDAIRDCECHVRNHNGDNPTHDELLMISAADNKCDAQDIEDLVMLIRRLPKIGIMTSEAFVANARYNLKRPSAYNLALRELETFKHLLRKT